MRVLVSGRSTWHGVSQTQMQSSRCWQMPPRSCVARAVRASCGGRGCASLAGGATCLAPAPLFCGCQELIGSDSHEVLACFCAGVEIFECSASPRRRHPRQSVPCVPLPPSPPRPPRNVCACQRHGCGFTRLLPGRTRSIAGLFVATVDVASRGSHSTQRALDHLFHGRLLPSKRSLSAESAEPTSQH